MIVPIKKLDKNAIIPKRQRPGDAGFDLHALEGGKVRPGEWKLVKTGIAMAVPNGYEFQVRPRSGLSYKYGITVVNSPGTIDSNYRGDIGVILMNLGAYPFEWEAGDRIAQGVFNEIPNTLFEEFDELPESGRGSKGFGSSGLSSTEKPKQLIANISVDTSDLSDQLSEINKAVKEANQKRLSKGIQGNL